MVFTLSPSGWQLDQLPLLWGQVPVKIADRAGPQTG